MDSSSEVVRISSLSVQSYSAELKTPLVTARGEIAAREGVYLIAHSESGHVGYGEIAPLPGFHEESLEQLADPLGDLIPQLGSLEFKATPNNLFEFGDHFRNSRSLPVSLVFGIETLVADLAARECGVSVAEWLNPKARKEVEVNSLFNQPPADAPASTVWKIKVYEDNPKQAINRIKEIAAAAGPDVVLRLDFNNSQDSQTLLDILSAIKELPVQYIEDPSPEIDLLRQIRNEFSIPIALDEAVVDDHDFMACLEAGVIQTIVMKPALYGGLSAVMSRAEVASEAGINCVVTSTLETEIGVAAALQLAAALPDPLLACGLGTLDLFQGSRSVALPLIDGRMRLPKGSGLGVSIAREN